MEKFSKKVAEIVGILVSMNYVCKYPMNKDNNTILKKDRYGN